MFLIAISNKELQGTFREKKEQMRKKYLHTCNVNKFPRDSKCAKNQNLLTYMQKSKQKRNILTPKRNKAGTKKDTSVRPK